ncbi:hypothetical protein HDU78_002756 [Chytriomyces hyalinus]|nr:hypothetical protein HDU78_002756 [Chytriomyces hyalinus]
MRVANPCEGVVPTIADNHQTINAAHTTTAGSRLLQHRFDILDPHPLQRSKHWLPLDSLHALELEIQAAAATKSQSNSERLQQQRLQRQHDQSLRIMRTDLSHVCPPALNSRSFGYVSLGRQRWNEHAFRKDGKNARRYIKALLHHCAPSDVDEAVKREETLCLDVAYPAQHFRRGCSKDSYLGFED